MDNFFEILIYVLIIVSFVSSFFRKKKVPPEDTPGDAQVRPGPVSRPQIKTEYSPKPQSREVEFDLFKEFENIFNATETKPKPQQTVVYSPVQEIQKTPEDFIPVPEKSFHEQTASEHSYTDKWERKRNEIEQKKKIINTKIEKEASQFEKYLKKETGADTGVICSLNQKLKNPSSVREYVIFSEILGKPKAYRKWNPKSIN